MTEGEKLVWAAAFASLWAQQKHDNYQYGTPVYVAGAVEGAWGAVYEMREVRPTVAEGYGADSEVCRMLDEMLKGGV